MILFIFILFNLPLIASPLVELKDVIQSSQKHYPLIQSALFDIEAAQMKVKESMGQFDLTLKAKSDNRIDGYYDGKNTDIQLIKPLFFMNSQLYGGYRISNGKFPTYDGKMETLSDGEFRLGLGVSLWKDLLIDDKRFALWSNQINEEVKKLKKIAIDQKIQKEATKAYFTWLAKANIMRQYQELLSNFEKRDEGIKKRIKNGDLAAIYGVENNQYVFKRKTDLVEAKQSFLEASQELSLYLRDEQGKPKIPSLEEAPSNFITEKKITSLEAKQAEKTLLEKDLDLKTTSLILAQIQNESKLAHNKLRPKLDVNFEVSKDQGQGAKNLQPMDQRLLLNIEVPIERREAKGKIGKAEAERRSMQEQVKLMTDQKIATLNKNINYINNIIEIIQNSQEEIKLAEILVKAEAEKVKQGYSEFFLLNMREQNLIDAKVKNIKAHADYQKVLAEYKESLLMY